MPSPSDAELVRRTLAGRTDAFARLVERWTHRVLALSYALVRRRQVAEELTQDTFVRAYVGLSSLRDAERFGAWLRGVARRASYDWLRAQRRLPLAGDLAAGGLVGRAEGVEPEAPTRVEAIEASARLLEEVDALPEDLRTTITIYYWGDHTYEEVAEMLGVSVATVNARLTKARALLRHRLRSLEA